MYHGISTIVNFKISDIVFIYVIRKETFKCVAKIVGIGKK